MLLILLFFLLFSFLIAAIISIALVTVVKVTKVLVFLEQDVWDGGKRLNDVKTLMMPTQNVVTVTSFYIFNFLLQPNSQRPMEVRRTKTKPILVVLTNWDNSNFAVRILL